MKRPILVTVIGLLAILSGVAQAVFGGLLLGLRKDVTFLADSKMTTDKVTYMAIALMAIGALTVLFAFGLLKGSGVSRALIGLIEVISIGFSIYIIAALDAARRPSAIGNIVGAVIVVYFLFGTDKAKAFFAHS